MIDKQASEKYVDVLFDAYKSHYPNYNDLCNASSSDIENIRINTMKSCVKYSSNGFRNIAINLAENSPEICRLKNSDYSSLMIKKEMNATAGNGNDLTARLLINNSLIIVTYGLSIGVTDKDWWVRIINWLKQNNNRILIIHWYEPDSINESIPQTKYLKRRQIINRIKEVTEIEEVTDKLNDRIIIYFNKNIFNFNLLANDKICIA